MCACTVQLCSVLCIYHFSPGSRYTHSHLMQTHIRVKMKKKKKKKLYVNWRQIFSFNYKLYLGRYYYYTQRVVELLCWNCEYLFQIQNSTTECYRVHFTMVKSKHNFHFIRNTRMSEICFFVYSFLFVGRYIVVERNLYICIVLKAAAIRLDDTNEYINPFSLTNIREHCVRVQVCVCERVSERALQTVELPIHIYIYI